MSGNVKKGEVMAERNEQVNEGRRDVGSVGRSCDSPYGGGDFGHIDVRHYYSLDPNDPSDEVGVVVHTGNIDGKDEQAALRLEPDEALSLAFLLQRAVGWIFDAHSDRPDIELEAARLTAKEM